MTWSRHALAGLKLIESRRLCPALFWGYAPPLTVARFVATLVTLLRRFALVALLLVPVVGGCGHERAPAVSLDYEPTSGGGGGSAGRSANTAAGQTAVDRPQCTPDVPNGLCLVSQRGDFVGAGKTVSTGASAAFRVWGGGGIMLGVKEPDGIEYELEFWPPLSQYFSPGYYERAYRLGSNPFGAAGLDVSADSRGCNELVGNFTVTEVGSDPLGNINRFAASFEQHCESSTNPGLFGAINYHARGEPDVVDDPGDCKVSTPIGFCFASQLGHPEGGGRLVTLDDKLATIALGVQRDSRIDANVATDSVSWHTGFAGPHGAPLHVGHYAMAGPLSQTLPLLTNPTCLGLAGSFDVLAIDYGTDSSGAGGETSTAAAGGAGGTPDETGSTLERFDVDFSYVCDGSQSELRGKLRYTRP